MTKTKIALYGFGGLPVVWRHLIDMARQEDLPLDWCLILTQPNWRELMAEVLPAGEVLDMFRELPRAPVGGDARELAGYHGSLAEDLAAQKRQWWPRSGQWIAARGHDTYRLYKGFLASRGATHLLTTNIETPDGKIAIAAARELGVAVLSPVDLRNLTGTMFAGDAVETPPAHARPTAETRRRAAELLAAFRAQWAPARGEPCDVDPAGDDRTILPGHLPGLGQRLAGFAAGARERPDLFDPVLIRNAVMSQSPLLQKAFWGGRARLNAPCFHVGSVAELPRRFVFYPLQYTPESSINTPAPYFVDQFRAIDALRFAMPPDCALVVKEHWACLQMRPLRFMRRMMRLPGVLVADSRLPARELVERAAVTASVTGTAVFEAFLAGRPAMALGPGLSAWALGGVTPLGELDSALRGRMGRPPATEAVIERLATLLDIRYSFYFGTPHTPGEPMLRRGNIRRFLAAILDHINRQQQHDARAGARVVPNVRAAS